MVNQTCDATGRESGSRTATRYAATNTPAKFRMLALARRIRHGALIIANDRFGSTDRIIFLAVDGPPDWLHLSTLFAQNWPAPDASWRWPRIEACR